MRSFPFPKKVSSTRWAVGDSLGLFAFYLLLGSCHGLRVFQEAVDQSTEERTNDRRNPEQPELTNGPIAHKQRNACAAGRIHRRIRDRNADQMDRVKPRPIASGAKPWGARLSMEPRIIKRNIRVMTISVTKAATKE